MRKTLLVLALALVFAAAFTFALVMPVQAAGGGGGCQLPPGCSYACSCNGTPLICCSGSCKVDLSGCWNCPQVNNC